MSTLSIQESLYPEITCFGCGHANPGGFHLRSYRDGDLTVATFTPRPEHDNGFGFVNRGIVSTVLDCHTAAVVLWEADVSWFPGRDLSLGAVRSRSSGRDRPETQDASTCGRTARAGRPPTGRR